MPQKLDVEVRRKRTCANGIMHQITQLETTLGGNGGRGGGGLGFGLWTTRLGPEMTHTVKEVRLKHFNTWNINTM